MKNILIYAYLIIVSGMGTACYNPDDYINIDEDKIISLDKKDTTIVADGVSSVPVVVRISDESVRGNRSVIFKTDLGFFKNGKGDSIVVNANEDFKAFASLASLRTGTATVSAKILGVKAKNNYRVTFEKAYPDKIVVSVDSFAIANNYQSEVLITASMSTNNGGKPSAGHPVSFFVSNANGVPLGDFLNNISTGISDIEGKVRVRFSAGEVDQNGYLTITATTTTATGSISGTTRIYLFNK
jgi:hypothetical protein